MFAYCLNNPVNFQDSLGSFALLFDVAQICFDETSELQSKHPKDSPPDHPDFMPPKKGNQKKKNPNGQGYGWVDQKGNIWVWTPRMHGGEGWTIQYPDGGHGHAYPGGKMRNHFESIPKNSILSDISSLPYDHALNNLPLLIPIIIIGGMAVGMMEHQLKPD